MCSSIVSATIQVSDEANGDLSAVLEVWTNEKALGLLS